MVQNRIDTEVYVGIEDNEIENLPKSDIILSICPNPFNPETTISFSVTQTSWFVTLEIFNIKGQKVETLLNEHKPAGKYSVIWNAEDKASSLYFVKIKSGDIQQFKKFMLIK